jgi:hypothetical protein
MSYSVLTNLVMAFHFVALRVSSAPEHIRALPCWRGASVENGNFYDEWNKCIA